MRLQRNASNSSGKIRLDMNRLDSKFRQDYLNLISASKNIAKVVATVTFSTKVRPEQSPDDRKKSAETDLYFMPYMTVNDLLIGFAHYNDVIREVAQAEKTLLIGGENTIPGDAKHFVDSVHFTDAGSVAMADRVANALIASAAVQALVAQKLQAHAARSPG